MGIWAVAPEMVSTAAPVLLVLACPLSMLFMMRSGGDKSGAACAMPNRSDAAPRETAQPAAPFAGGREAHLAQLKAELTQTRERQEAIARRLAELEVAESTAVRQAEAVAHSASER